MYREILMEVAATNVTSFNSYEGFVVFGFWLGHIDNTYISYPEVLSCFHGTLLRADVCCY